MSLKWRKKWEHFNIYLIMLPQEAERITQIEMLENLFHILCSKVNYRWVWVSLDFFFIFFFFSQKALWNGFIHHKLKQGVCKLLYQGLENGGRLIKVIQFYLAKEIQSNERKKNQTAGDSLPILSHTAVSDSATIPKATLVDFSKAM